MVCSVQYISPLISVFENFQPFQANIPFCTESVVRRCSVKKAFLKISQHLQENTCARVSFNKVAGVMPLTLLKKRLCHRCFPVKFAKFLRTSFIVEHLRWLLLFVSARNIRKPLIFQNFLSVSIGRKHWPSLEWVRYNNNVLS